jgi:methyl-accepting chemotaxis protein
VSAPRRRRWIDVLRVAASPGSPRAGLEEADLWTSRDDAARATEEGSRAAERLEVTSARERARAEAASERATLLAARAEAIGLIARRVEESFERLRMVALNAGLEGARAPEPVGRTLLLIGDEVRALVDRGTEAARDLVASVDEVTVEAAALRDRAQEVRADAAEIAADAASAKGSALEAGRALERLEQQLRKATGYDPEVARAVALAGEHAKGLVTALSTIQTSQVGSMALVALRPVLRPLARALGEIVGGAEGDDGGAPG